MSIYCTSLILTARGAEQQSQGVNNTLAYISAIGVATGLIGAFGGIGGFLLPILMGNAKQSFYTCAPDWVVLAGFVLIALVVLRILMALHSDRRSSWVVMREAEPATTVVGTPQLTSTAQKG